MTANEIRKARRNDRLSIGFVALVTIAIVALIYGTVYPWVPGPRPQSASRLTAAELAAAWADGGPLIIDARSYAEYTAGHIPGAVSLSFDDLRDPIWELLRTPDDLASLLAEKGISPDRPVVVYADQILDAAYVGWALLIMGHSDVSLLNGGIQAWIAADDRPLETGSGTPLPPADPSAWAVASQTEWSVDEHYVDTAVLYNEARNNSDYVLIDTRPFGERFSIIDRQLDNPKHREYHLPWSDLVTDDGTALKHEMIIHQYTHQFPGKLPIVVYGNDPRESAVVWWALYEQGYAQVINFDDTYEFWEMLFPTRRLEATPTTAPTPRIGGGCG